MRITVGGIDTAFLECTGRGDRRFILVDKENPFQTITEDANGIEVANGGLLDDRWMRHSAAGIAWVFGG